MLGSQEKTKGISRRGFLGVGFVVSMVGLFGQAGAALLRFFRPRLEPGSFGGVVVAGQVDEFELGTVSRIQKARCYLTRLEDGGFLALWQRCTHLGCTVPWREEEGRFNCPCHSSIFDVAGLVVSGPAPRPMDIFPVEITDNEILIDTGNPIERAGFDPDHVAYV